MKTVDNDIQKIRESAVAMRKTADLFDKLGDILENEEIDEKEREAIAEETLGQIFVQTLKAQAIFN